MSRVTGPVSAASLRVQESNQVQAFRTGQLASYLGFVHKALMCPTDAVESRGSKRDLYLQRPIKIISYDWTQDTLALGEDLQDCRPATDRHPAVGKG